MPCTHRLPTGALHVGAVAARAIAALALSALALSVLAVLPGCDSRATRSVDASGGARDGAIGRDGGSAVDTAALPDVAIAPDSSSRCGKARLAMGFVTDAPATSPLQDVTLIGKVTYLGKVRAPLASSPAFVGEVELSSTARRLIVQYFLPSGVALPVRVGETYTFTVKRRRVGNGLRAEAWVISRPTSGISPLVFVAEPAAYGQALDGADPLMTPLRVERVVQTGCPSGGPDACAKKQTDRLRFSGATGAPLELLQGLSGTMTLFGSSYRVFNLESWHLVQPCPDAQVDKAAFLVVINRP